MLFNLIPSFGFHFILQNGEKGTFNGWSLKLHVVNPKDPERWQLLPILYLGSLLFIYGG